MVEVLRVLEYHGRAGAVCDVTLVTEEEALVWADANDAIYFYVEVNVYERLDA